MSIEVSEIETAIRSLSPQKLSEFRAWYEKFDADAWDLQIEQDVNSGRLDKLASEAVDDLNRGRCRDL